MIDSESPPLPPDREEKLSLGQTVCADLERRLEAARAMGPAEVRARHQARGKLLVRERIARLFDPGADWLELSPLAAMGHYGDEVPAAGVVAAIGPVHGRRVLTVANDGTVKGGTFYPLSLSKQLRAMEIAQENRLPVVYLVDSGGAFLPLQSQIFPDRNHGGRIFYTQARMSAAGLPQVAVVLGLCTAGAAYTPSMCDVVIIVRGSGAIFLGGPPLVKAATGEVVSPEELGGADVHARISGVADEVASSEEEGLAQARAWIAQAGGAGGPIAQDGLGGPGRGGPDHTRAAPDTARVASAGDDELRAMIARSAGEIVDAAGVARRLADGGRLDAGPRAGATDAADPSPPGPGVGRLLTAHARIGGIHCGILSLSGRTAAQDLADAAGFVATCERAGMPLVVLQNPLAPPSGPAGVGAGARLLGALIRAHVPRVTVVLSPAAGLGDDLGGGRATRPRFLFRWPLPVGVQAPPGESWVHPYAATALVEDEGVIDPARTRSFVAIALSVAGSAGGPMPG